jgi:hypothetical protein
VLCELEPDPPGIGDVLVEVELRRQSTFPVAISTQIGGVELEPEPTCTFFASDATIVCHTTDDVELIPHAVEDETTVPLASSWSTSHRLLEEFELLLGDVHVVIVSEIVRVTVL